MRCRYRAGVPEDRSLGATGVLELRVRIEVQPVQARVQRLALGVGLAAHAHHAESFLPGRGRRRMDLVEGAAGELERGVVPCLRQADERGGQPQLDGPAGEGRVAGLGVATRSGTGAGGLGRERTGEEHPAAPDREPAAVVDPARQRAGRRVEDEGAVLVHGVEDQAAAVGGEGEPHDGAVIGGRQLGRETVQELDLVVVGAGELIAVGEGECASSRAAGRYGGGGRHHRQLVPVTHPRARLVRDGEALQHGVVVRVVGLLVVVLPAVGRRVGNRGQERESVRQGADGQVVAAREGTGRVRTAPGVDDIGQRTRVHLCRCRVDLHVVDPAGEVRVRLGGRVVVGEKNAIDGLSVRHVAQGAALGVPLIGIENLAVALTGGGEGNTVLVRRVQL